MSGRLYADLSKIAEGAATVLFLADIPDQVRLLTIHGKFKMGFRDPAGNEVTLQTVDLQAGTPYGVLAGPRPERLDRRDRGQRDRLRRRGRSAESAGPDRPQRHSR